MSHQQHITPHVPEADESDSVMGALRSPTKPRTEVLAGLVVALALIPEAISFPIIAGVVPTVGSPPPPRESPPDGPVKGTYFDAYVMIDIYSRYIVGAHVHTGESGPWPWR